MVKQLVFHGCGIMNSHEWYGCNHTVAGIHLVCPRREALVCWIRWADSLWLSSYTGEHSLLWGLHTLLDALSEADFAHVEELRREWMEIAITSGLAEVLGEVL